MVWLNLFNLQVACWFSHCELPFLAILIAKQNLLSANIDYVMGDTGNGGVLQARKRQGLWTQVDRLPVKGTPQMRTMSGRLWWKKLLTIL